MLMLLVSNRMCLNYQRTCFDHLNELVNVFSHHEVHDELNEPSGKAVSTIIFSGTQRLALRCDVLQNVALR